MNDSALILISNQQLFELITQALIGVLKDVPYPSPSQQNEELLTRNEAAEMLNVTPTTLTKYVKQGRLKAGGADRKYLFMKSDLLKFMFNRK